MIDTAYVHAHRAIELDPRLADAWVALGDVYARDLKPAKAEAEYRRAQKLNPGSTGVLRGLIGVLSVRGRTDEYLRLARRGVSLDPTNPRPYEAVTNAYFRLGDYESAFLWASKLLELAPDNALPHQLLAEMYRQRGDADQARAELQWLMQHVPEDVNTWLYAAKLAMDRGSWDEAVRLLEKTLELAPNARLFNNQILPHLALAYIKTGQRSRAEPQLRVAEDSALKYLQRGDHRPRTYLTLASVYSIRDMHDEALRYLRLGHEHGVTRSLEEFLFLPEKLRDDPRYQQLVRESLARRDSMRALVKREGY
jgi:Tfp pilus assembly protein PilF